MVACEAMAQIAPKDSRTQDLCQAAQQKIMQRQLEQQMQQDLIQQDIDRMNEESMRSMNDALNNM